MKQNTRVVFQGNIVEVVQEDVEINGNVKVFEYARRAPGVRLIIPQGDQILLTTEKRHEHGGLDYRLPGGKVFDTLRDYNEFLASGGDILTKAREAAVREGREEVGVEIEELEHFATSHCGATVIWDLYYFVVKKFHFSSAGQHLEAGETIKLEPVNLAEAQKICLDGRMQEDRSVAILLRYLHKQ